MSSGPAAPAAAGRTKAASSAAPKVRRSDIRRLPWTGGRARPRYRRTPPPRARTSVRASRARLPAGVGVRTRVASAYLSRRRDLLLHRRLAAAAVLAACAFPAAASAAFSPGAPGAGDPFFPAAGNGGIDVAHYELRLGFAPSTRELTARATLSVKATQDLSQFDL